MPLSVSTARPGRISKVGVNFGFQDTHNPQAAASGEVVQTTVPAKKLQPAASGNSVQPAAPVQSAADVARIAAEQQQRVLAEAKRLKQQRAAVAQSKLDLNVSVATDRLQAGVTQVQSRRALTVVHDTPAKIAMPELSATERARVDAYWKAYNDYNSRIDSNKSGVSKFWDKLTFGQDRRQAAAREYAASQLDSMSKSSVEDFRLSVNSFQAEQATRKAKIESSKFKSQAEFDAAKSEYATWEAIALAKLQQKQAELQGLSDAYGLGAEAPLTSRTARVFGGAVKAAQSSPLSKVWQYTLGSGSKNIPSLVTAPSRLLNFFGNLNTQDRQIYQTGGGSAQRNAGILSAWQATQNQRNFNIRPWTDIQPGPQADKLLGDKVRALIDVHKKMGRTDPASIDYAQVMQRELHQYNLQHRAQNTGLELLADPLNILGGVGKISRFSGVSAKLATSVSASRPARLAQRILDSARSTRFGQWATAEATNPQQRLGQAIANRSAARQAHFQKYKDEFWKLVSASTDRPKSDMRVFDEIASFTDAEAAAFQRVVDGKLAVRDYLPLVGVGKRAARERFLSIVERYKSLMDDVHAADNITNSRFIGSGSRLYVPQAPLLKGDQPADPNWFRYFRKHNRRQSAAAMTESIRQRLFDSNYDSVMGTRAAAARNADIKLARMHREKLQLETEHDALIRKAKADTQTFTGRVRGFVSRFGPTALWKKSVLKFRPAWYTNNFLYNSQAAVLSGGGRALLEQTKMLSPRYFRRAMHDVPASVKADLVGQTGRGRLTRFANNVENLSRVAAFRALKSKGFDDATALRRVNKYLLDYSTKNWERPLKAAVPFWNFQKGLTKAAVNMPFDRPAGAIAYHRLDQYQQQQFDVDFNKIVPKLRALGYSDAEIEAIRTENAKYFAGRLRVKGRYYSTPFNAFSEKGLSNLGLHPFIAAPGEVANSRDIFGRQLAGADSSFYSRFVNKIPQLQLLREAKFKFDVRTGRKRPTTEWIGAAGSEGYGLTKQAQGFDSSLPNYQKNLDKGAKFWENFTAFLGQPRSSTFDTKQLLDRKTMQKLKEEYFATDWNSMDFPTAEAQRAALFAKYGVSSDQFYSGELARYDDANTQRIKQLKQDAWQKTSDLFAEYSRQPQGTRNVWATMKLKQLTDSGYFDTNPFLRSFDWTTPETIRKAYKKIAYDDAKQSGDWSAYNRVFGSRRSSPFTYDGKFFKSAESMQRYKSGTFWRKYIAADAPTRRQLLRDNPEFAKHDPKTEQQIAEAQFWYKYSQLTPDGRKQLLADNPQMNKRANWTRDQWNSWRAESKSIFAGKVRSIDSIANNERQNLRSNQAMAYLFTLQPKRTKKIKYRLPA